MAPGLTAGGSVGAIGGGTGAGVGVGAAVGVEPDVGGGVGTGGVGVAAVAAVPATRVLESFFEGPPRRAFGAGGGAGITGASGSGS